MLFIFKKSEVLLRSVQTFEKMVNERERRRNARSSAQGSLKAWASALPVRDGPRRTSDHAEGMLRPDGEMSVPEHS